MIINEGQMISENNNIKIESKDEVNDDIIKNKKFSKKITKCPHKDAKHYAKVILYII